MAESYSSGTTPKAADTLRVLEIKILNKTGGGGSSGTAVASGAGAPVADPGVAAALYVDTNTGTLWEFYSGAWH